MAPTPRHVTPTHELVLMAQVARRHFLRRQSKVEIAADLQLSRFRVARLIDAALEHGVVRIEVGIPGDIDVALSAELRERFGLLHCIVVDLPDDTERVARAVVGATATQLLCEIVGPHDVLGLSATRVLMGLESPVPRFARCPVVQVTGGVSRPDASDVMEAVRRFTRVGGGAAYVFYAPLICPDEVAHSVYARQPDVARCRALLDQVTVSVTGVGAWQPGLSTVYDALSPADRLSAQEAGVTVEVAGLLVGEDGHVVDSPLARRLIGMSEGELRRIPTRIGVAYHRGRAGAVYTALSTGLINAVVLPRTLAADVADLA